MFKLHEALALPPAPEAGADPFVDALVAQATARYAAFLSPEALIDLEDELRMYLTAHPRASRIVDRARPRADRKRSGDDAIAGVEMEDDDDKIGGRSS